LGVAIEKRVAPWMMIKPLLAKLVKLTLQAVNKMVAKDFYTK